MFLYRGELGALAALSRESCERYPHLQATHTANMTLRAALGDRDEARAYARAWRSKTFAVELQATNWLFEATCLAELSFYVNDEELVERLYRFLEPHRHKNVIVGQAIVYNGPVAHYLALLACVLGRDDVAAGHFEHALERARAFDAGAWVTRIQTAYARLLRRRGGDDAVSADSLFAEACASAHRMEAAGLETMIAAAQAGWRNPHNTRSHAATGRVAGGNAACSARACVIACAR